MKRKSVGLVVTSAVITLLLLCLLGYSGYKLADQYVQWNTQQQIVKQLSLDTKAQAALDPKSKSDNAFSFAQNQLKPIAAIIIPKIRLSLPVYSNSSQEALDKGAGWWPESSPITGGKGKHAVIDAHSGKSAKLFTDIYKLKKNDKIYLRVSGQWHEYAVTSDDHVKAPANYLQDLTPKKGSDLLTLITCWPIYQNSKRLHVTSLRIPYDGKAEQSTLKDFLLTNMWWILICTVSLLALLGKLVGWLLRTRKERGNEK